MTQLTANEWTSPDVIQTIKKTVCPDNITDDEFKLFIMFCQSKKLNPLTRDVWCLKTKDYNNKQGQRVQGKLQIMMGIDGYLSRANRNPNFDGMKTQTQIDAATAKPISTTCIIWRKDRAHPTEFTAWFSESYRPNPYGNEGTWDKMPIRMLEKCAKAGALREAFPDEFEGTYIPEEIEVEPEMPGRDYLSTNEKRKQRALEAAKVALPEPPQSMETATSSDDVPELYMYRVLDPTEAQLKFLKAHADYDESTKVWSSRTTLGPKLESKRITWEDIHEDI